MREAIATRKAVIVGLPDITAAFDTVDCDVVCRRLKIRRASR